MRKTLFGLLTALLAVPLAGSLTAQSYGFDPNHTVIGFEALHLGFTHIPGKFTSYTGALDIDEKDPSQSALSLTIEAASVDTGVEFRDKDLRSEKFFDVAKNPAITFKSTKIVKTKDGYDLTGDLSIHGVTKPVTLQAQLSDAQDMGKMGTRRFFNLRGSISRFDYGITWGAKTPGGTLIVGENVALVIDGELVKK